MTKQTPLKDSIKAYHYKISEKSVTEIEKLRVLRDNIPNNIILFQANPLNISLQEAITDSEKFMKSNFKLRPIMYLENYEILSNNGDNVDIKMSVDNAMDPYNLPIEKTNEKRSSVESLWIAQEKEYPTTYFRKIKIQEKITEFTPKSVTHEITHTQILKEETLKYHTNIETLPILLEMIHYLYKYSISEVYKRAVYKRLKHLLENINYIERVLIGKEIHSLLAHPGSYDEKFDEAIISTSTYLESTLKALNLFGLYENSNINIKQEMLNYIQSIFDGHRSVEDFLKYYDTTFESSIDSLQKKVKQIKL